MNGMQRGFVSILGAILCLAAIPRSSARSIHDCVTGSEAFDFTNRNGALVIPVQIDKKNAGAFFSTLNTRTTVWPAKGFEFERQPPMDTISVFGDGSAYTTTIASLTLEHTTITDLTALIGEQKAFVTPAGLPLMIDIGWDVLGGFNILIDRHSDKVVIFSYSTDADCPKLGTLMHDTGPAIPMLESEGIPQQTDDIRATLDGHEITMNLDTSANRTIIRQRVARRLGVTRAQFDQDDQIRVGAGAVVLGHRHRFHELVIGSHVFHDITLDVVPDSAFNILGMDILRHFNVLIEGPGAKLWLEDYTPPPGTPQDKALPWSPLHDRLIITSVHEEKSPLPRPTARAAPPSGGLAATRPVPEEE